MNQKKITWDKVTWNNFYNFMFEEGNDLEKLARIIDVDPDKLIRDEKLLFELNHLVQTPIPTDCPKKITIGIHRCKIPDNIEEVRAGNQILAYSIIDRILDEGGRPERLFPELICAMLLPKAKPEENRHFIEQLPCAIVYPTGNFFLKICYKRVNEKISSLNSAES